ncbi:MAG: hypothetical protein DMG72_23340 [Acidobacteria bacterium]|nr:MAG: hypothetical protein DMG72_23340 [Acidobacteriota bacterium]
MFHNHFSRIGSSVVTTYFRQTVCFPAAFMNSITVCLNSVLGRICRAFAHELAFAQQSSTFGQGDLLHLPSEQLLL